MGLRPRNEPRPFIRSGLVWTIDMYHVIWAMPALKVLCWMERLLECVSSHSQAFDLTHVWYLQLLVPRMVFSCSKNRVPLNRSTCTLFSRAQMMVHFHIHDIHFFAASSFLNGTPLQGTATSMSCAVLSDETVAKRAETPAEHSPLDCRTIPQRKDANKKSPADPSR